jgi:RpiB/LacA/LacB family sugar-phosphate isomerase
MIYIGADHKGFELKAKINKWLQGRELEFQDLGAFEYDHDDDYVDYAVMVAQSVGKNPDKNRGIVICGSGVGVDIAANKVSRARCGLGWETDQVHAARKDDNINILALAAENVDEPKALKLVETFLNTEFVNSERYLRRIEKIARFENAISHS